MNSFSDKGRTIFIIILLIVLSFYPTLIDSYQILLHKEIMGVSPIGAWGQQHGYTIVGFALCYSVGAWLRLNKISERVKKWKTIGVIVVTVALIYVWFKIEEKTVLADASLLEYNALSYTNPLVLLLASFLIVLFSTFSFKSSLINGLAKGSFMCYIFHLHVIPYLKISDYAKIGGIPLFVHLFSSIIAIYIASWIIWRVWDFVLKPMIEWLGRYEIFPIKKMLMRA